MKSEIFTKATAALSNEVDTRDLQMSDVDISEVLKHEITTTHQSSGVRGCDVKDNEEYKKEV